MEEWKDIPGYEELYQASNYGRVRTHPNKITQSARFPERHWKVRILKSRGKGYQTGKRASLWKNGKCKDWLQARLVAMVWVDGYEDGLTVNHMDGNRLNNDPKNLEWVTLANNIRHGFRTGLYSASQKRIALVDSRSGSRYEFASMAEAGRFLKKGNQYISGRLSKGKHTAGEYEIIQIVD